MGKPSFDRINLNSFEFFLNNWKNVLFILGRVRVLFFSSLARVASFSPLVACHVHKSSSLLSIDAWLSPLLLWLKVEEKLDGDPQIGQLAYCGCSWEFLFLRSSDFVQLYYWLVKSCYALIM
jgi:hypothetical protein